MQYSSGHTRIAFKARKLHQHLHWTFRVYPIIHSTCSPLQPVATRSCKHSDSDFGSSRQFMVDISSNMLTGAGACLTAQERMRLDESPDDKFYDEPRMGPHADQNFELALTGLYMKLLQPNSSVLDLCSSYSSYLPQSVSFTSVVGVGMNTEEMASNRQLTSYHVEDLNRNPKLSSLPDACFKAALCANGLQYLTRPERVLTEVLRTLQPGGRVIISFSKYCWESKAISAWLQRTPDQRMELIARLLRHAGFKHIQFVCWDQHTAFEQGIHSSSISSAYDLASLLELQDHVPQQLTATSSNTTESSPDTTPQQRDNPVESNTGYSKISQPVAFGSVAHVTQPPSFNNNQTSNQLPDLQQSNSWDPLYAVTAVKPLDNEGSGVGNPDGTRSRTPQQVASEYVSPALMEIELMSRGVNENVAAQEQVQPETLERWRYAYAAMRIDAQALGIPASVIPHLPDDATAQQIREARDHLERMMASFLSAGL